MTCPTCGAPRIPGHPAGPITYSHTTTCPIGAHEDARRVADHEQAAGSPASEWQRPITPTEITLLAPLLASHDLVPPAHTTVSRLTAGGAVIHRDWMLSLTAEAAPHSRRRTVTASSLIDPT